MAANTALVVRQPAPQPGPKRRNGRGSTKGRIGIRQVGFGVAGAAASAAVAAGLCSWFGMRPMWAGAATGGLGTLGAIASRGPALRPFAAGAALGGGAVALTGALGNFAAPEKKADKTEKDDKGGKSGPPLLSAPPSNTKNANAMPRSAGSMTDAMREQIARAMQETRYRDRR